MFSFVERALGSAASKSCHFVNIPPSQCTRAVDTALFARDHVLSSASPFATWTSYLCHRGVPWSGMLSLKATDFIQIYFEKYVELIAFVLIGRMQVCLHKRYISWCIHLYTEDKLRIARKKSRGQRPVPAKLRCREPPLRSTLSMA